jgi:hypothetical protein
VAGAGPASVPAPRGDGGRGGAGGSATHTLPSETVTVDSRAARRPAGPWYLRKAVDLQRQRRAWQQRGRGPLEVGVGRLHAHELGVPLFISSLNV